MMLSMNGTTNRACSNISRVSAKECVSAGSDEPFMGKAGSVSSGVVSFEVWLPVWSGITGVDPRLLSVPSKFVLSSTCGAPRAAVLMDGSGITGGDRDGSGGEDDWLIDFGYTVPKDGGLGPDTGVHVRRKSDLGGGAGRFLIGSPVHRHGLLSPEAEEIEKVRRRSYNGLCGRIWGLVSAEGVVVAMKDIVICLLGRSQSSLWVYDAVAEEIEDSNSSQCEGTCSFDSLCTRQSCSDFALQRPFPL